MSSFRPRLRNSFIVTGLIATALAGAMQVITVGVPQSTAQFIPGTGAGGGAAGVSSITTSSNSLTLSGSTGAVTINQTTTGVNPGGLWFYDGSNWVTGQQSLPRYTWGCTEEMTGAVQAATAGVCTVGILSGTTITNLGVTDVTHPGAQLWVVDAATDRVTLISNGSSANSIVFASGANVYSEWIFQIDAASNGTDTYTLRVGFIDVVNADAVDGAYFELNSNADTEFQCKVASNSSRVTASPDTGVTFAINTWYKVRVEVDAASTVRFYINGTQVCTASASSLNAGLPSGATRATQAGMSFIASAGTGVRNLSLDYLSFGGYFTGAGR
jgi:hypothetical protein